MSNEIVIGSVPYLNGRPLVRWFWDTDTGRGAGVRVIEAVPSQLAVLLEQGEIAAALVSSFELFRSPGLCYAPGIAVAADGPVLSVRMLSKVPFEQIRSVALDTSSLTSVALLKILLAERYGLNPRYQSAPPDLTTMLDDADAALLIGDKGYREYGEHLYSLDLGEGWKGLTGLPFAYALWIGPEGVLTPALAATLTWAKEWGKAHLEQIAHTEFTGLQETYARTEHYLTHIMNYDMGAPEERALQLFGEKAWENGLLPERPTPHRCAVAPSSVVGTR